MTSMTPMNPFTVDELTRIMRGVGVPAQTDLGAGMLDTSFTDLGYDSLAVLEIAGQVGQQLQVSVPDELTDGRRTPRELIGYVNQQLAGV